MARSTREVKLVTKTWWALVRGPRELPVIFATRDQARENREDDEYLVRVKVEEAGRGRVNG